MVCSTPSPHRPSGDKVEHRDPVHGISSRVTPASSSELEPGSPEKIVEVLRAYVSEDRRRRIQSTLDARTRDVVPVLEHVVHEHNGAAVVRTSDALGIQEVHLIQPDQAFRVSRKVARGAFKWLDILKHTSVEEGYGALRHRGYAVYASSLRPQSRSVDELPMEGKMALVFGNEREGLSEEAMQQADGAFHVPMVGFVESLNVSVAAAVALYSVVTRRRRAGTLGGVPDRLQLEARWYQKSVRASRQLLAREGLAPIPHRHQVHLELR